MVGMVWLFVAGLSPSLLDTHESPSRLSLGVLLPWVKPSGKLRAFYISLQGWLWMVSHEVTSFEGGREKVRTILVVLITLGGRWEIAPFSSKDKSLLRMMVRNNRSSLVLL